MWEHVFLIIRLFLYFVCCLTQPPRPFYVCVYLLLPELADIIIGLVNSQLAGPHGVERGGVGLVLEVGAIGVRALTTGPGDWNIKSQ